MSIYRLLYLQAVVDQDKVSCRGWVCVGWYDQLWKLSCKAVPGRDLLNQDDLRFLRPFVLIPEEYLAKALPRTMLNSQSISTLFTYTV